MRRLMVIAVMMAGMSVAAEAADMPDLPILRGPVGEGFGPTVVNWQGVYVGGHYAYGSSQANLSNATRDITARLLENTTIEQEFQVSRWPVLNSKTSSAGGFGAFVGYNMQWEDVVLGVEGNYVRGEFGAMQTGQMARSFNTSDGYTNGVNYRSTAGLNLTDMGGFRARAGYAFSAFLPYAFVGAAFGVADVVRSSRVSGTQVNPNAAPGFQVINFDVSTSASQGGRFLYGYNVGLGIDVMLIGGVFARLEYEYLKFAAPIDTNVNSVRAGIGYKF